MSDLADQQAERAALADLLVRVERLEAERAALLLRIQELERRSIPLETLHKTVDERYLALHRHATSQAPKWFLTAYGKLYFDQIADSDAIKSLRPDTRKTALDVVRVLARHCDADGRAMLRLVDFARQAHMSERRAAAVLKRLQDLNLLCSQTLSASVAEGPMRRFLLLIRDPDVQAEADERRWNGPQFEPPRE